MGYFKLLNKIFPASPDQILKKATDAEAAVARMAHVNTIVNDLSDIAHYTLDVNSTFTVPITTNKGIIDVENFDSLFPLPPGFNPIIFTLTNDPVLNIANRDKVYIQLTPYYSPAFDDQFIPYIVATGFLDGLNISVIPVFAGGTNDGQGAFYIYYEIKYLG